MFSFFDKKCLTKSSCSFKAAILLYFSKLDLFHTGVHEANIDDGYRKKPNDKNRKSNSKSVFRLLSARKIVGHLEAHANFVFQAIFKN